MCTAVSEIISRRTPSQRGRRRRPARRASRWSLRLRRCRVLRAPSRSPRRGSRARARGPPVVTGVVTDVVTEDSGEEAEHRREARERAREREGERAIGRETHRAHQWVDRGRRGEQQAGVAQLLRHLSCGVADEVLQRLGCVDGRRARRLEVLGQLGHRGGKRRRATNDEASAVEACLTPPRGGVRRPLDARRLGHAWFVLRARAPSDASAEHEHQRELPGLAPYGDPTYTRKQRVAPRRTTTTAAAALAAAAAAAAARAVVGQHHGSRQRKRGSRQSCGRRPVQGAEPR